MYTPGTSVLVLIPNQSAASGRATQRWERWRANDASHAAIMASRHYLA
jgi:hypothetical protein